MNPSALAGYPEKSWFHGACSRWQLFLLAQMGLVALGLGLALPAPAQTLTTNSARGAAAQQSSQSDAEKKRQEAEKKRQEAEKKRQEEERRKAAAAAAAAQKKQPPLKLNIPVKVLQKPPAQGQQGSATTAPSDQRPGTIAPPTNRQPGTNQQPPTNRQPGNSQPPIYQPQQPIYIPQQPQTPPMVRVPPQGLASGRCATTQGRMAGFLITLTTWDEKKSKSDSRCAFSAVNGTANMQFDLPGATPFAVSFSKLHLNPEGQVTEGRIEVADFNPSASATESHAYSLALNNFQFEIHSLRIDPRIATGDIDLVITQAMDLRLPSAGGRVVEGALKCNVRGLLGDGMLQASCPLTATWQAGVTPFYLGDPGGSSGTDTRHIAMARSGGKGGSAFDIDWPSAATAATSVSAISAMPTPQLRMNSATPQAVTAINPATTQMMSNVSAQLVATYVGPLYLKSPFIDKLDTAIVPTSFSLALAPDGIRGNAAFANASFFPLFPDGFKLTECSGQYEITASAITNGTMAGKVALPDNYWDDNHHVLNGTFNGTLDATGSLNAPVKLLPLQNGADASIVWDSFGSTLEPPPIRIFLPKAVAAASLVTLQTAKVGGASSLPSPQPVQTRAGLSTAPMAAVALRPAEVVLLTQQAAAVPLMTMSQYAARSTQTEERNLAPAFARLEAASVARYSGKATNSQAAQLGNVAQILNQPILWSILLGKATLNVWGKGHELVEEPTPSYGLQIGYGWLTTPWLGAQDENDPTKTGPSPIFFFNSDTKGDGFVLTAAGAYGGMHYQLDHSIEFPGYKYSQYEGFNIQFEDFDLKFGRGRLTDSHLHSSLRIPFGDLEFELVNMEVDPTNDVNFVGGELIGPEKWELGKGSPISIVPSAVILKERAVVFDGLFYVDLLRNYKDEVQAFTAHQGKILVFRNDAGHQCAKLADMNTSADEKQTIGGLAATLREINFDSFVSCADEDGTEWPYLAMDTDLVMPGFGKKSVQFQVYDGSYKGETCGPPPGNLHAPVNDYHTCINYATDHASDFKDTFDLARQMPVGNDVEMVTGISLKLAPPDYKIWRGVSYIDVPELGLVTGPWSADAIEGKVWRLIPSSPPDDTFGANLPAHSGGSVVEGAHLRFTCNVDYWNNVCQGSDQQLDPNNPPDPSNWIEFSDDTGITKFGLHGATTMGKADKDGNPTGDVQVPSSDTAIEFEKDTATFSVKGTVPGGSDLTPGKASASGDDPPFDGKKVTLSDDGPFKLYFDASDYRLYGSFDSFQPGSGGNNMPSGTPEVGVRFNFWVDGGYFDIGAGIKNIPLYASLRADGALGVFYTKNTEGAYMLGDVFFDWTGAGTGVKGEGHLFVDAFAKVKGTEVKDLMHDLIQKDIVKKLDGLNLWPPTTNDMYFGAGLGIHAEVDVLSWDLADLDADFIYEYGDLGPPNYPDGSNCSQCSGFRGYLGAKVDDLVHWRGRVTVLNGSRDISTTCCDATVFWSDSCEDPGDTGLHGMCSW